MEQKRTLWIIAAAGMFLLVVLGAAFILYSPAQRSAPSVIAQNYQTQVPAADRNGSGWTNVPPAYNGTLLPPAYDGGEVRAKELTVISDNTVVYAKDSAEGTTIDLNALKTAAEQNVVQPNPQNINITVNLPEAKYEQVTVAPAETSVKAPVENVKPAVTEKPVQKASVARAPAPAKPQPAPKAETKVVEKKIDQYWVQAAAYSNKKTAETARSVLDNNKIPADIFTYQDAKGKVFYRVRVGPYTTKSEAEYWRTRIVKIDEFAKSESYVTAN